MTIDLIVFISVHIKGVKNSDDLDQEKGMKIEGNLLNLAILSSKKYKK